MSAGLLCSVACSTLRDTQCMCCSPYVPIPYMRENVTAKTIQHCLRAGGAIDASTVVESIDAVSIAAGEGMLSEIARVKVNYSSGSGPSSLICKSTPKPFSTRLVSRLFRLFATEVSFYENKIPEESGMASGKVYYVSYDEKHAR